MFNPFLSRRGMIILAAALAGLLALILGITWTMSTHDDGPSRADVVARIESDPRMADSPDTVVNCMADWYMTSATAQQRAAFVAGEVTAPDPAAEADPALVECLKRAADPPA